MDPKTNVKYLDLLTARLTEFIDLFDQFMEMQSRTLAPVQWREVWRRR